MLEGTTPIETPKHGFKNFNEARTWAKENIVGTYKNADTDVDIYIAKNAIDKYMSSSAVLKSANKDVHISVIKVLPKLIETSLLKETSKDKYEDYHIQGIQRLYGSVTYENKIYPVKITVKVIRDEGNKAYSYEVLDVENPSAHLGHSGSDFPGGQWNASAPQGQYTFPHSDKSTAGTSEAASGETSSLLPNPLGNLNKDQASTNSDGTLINGLYPAAQSRSSATEKGSTDAYGGKGSKNNLEDEGDNDNKNNNGKGGDN
jgi:hypothetical protein